MTTYTLVAVPSELVPAVTELIESWGRPGTSASPGVPTHPPGPADSGDALHNHWTRERIEDAYLTARPNMQRILELLAGKPGQEFGMDDLEDELGIAYKDLNGLLGGFSKVNNGKYGSTYFPWSADKVDGRVKHTMSAPVAAVVREAAARS